MTCDLARCRVTELVSDPHIERMKNGRNNDYLKEPRTENHVTSRAPITAKRFAGLRDTLSSTLDRMEIHKGFPWKPLGIPFSSKIVRTKKINSITIADAITQDSSR